MVQEGDPGSRDEWAVVSLGEETPSVQSSAPEVSARRSAGKHALYVAWDFLQTRGQGVCRMRETANALVDLGWEVTVVAGDLADPDHHVGSDAGPPGDVHPAVEVVRVPPDLDSSHQSLLAAVDRVHSGKPIDVTIAAGGRFVSFDAGRHLWDKDRTPYLLDYYDSSPLRQLTDEHIVGAGSGVPAAEAEFVAKAAEVWFVNDAMREWHESVYPSLTSKSRLVAAVGEDAGALELRAALSEVLTDLDTVVESARAMERLLAERGASGPREMTVYEVPRPSTRTVRMMDTLRASGVATKVINWGTQTAIVRGLGFDSVPFSNRKYSLLKHVQTRLADLEMAEPGTVDGRLRELHQAMLDVPVPSTRPIWQDLNVLAQDWFDVARLMVESPSPVYWAADLNALPPAVWAKRAVPGTRVILDAHELFTELDYLDPTQRVGWEEVAETFLPEVDLVITVGQGIADELVRRHRVPRVEVIESLAIPTRFPRSDVRSTAGLQEETPLVVHIGNVSNNRNPLLAVQLLQHNTRLHFAFVGEVREGLSDTLRSAAEETGVSDRLHFVGNVPREDLQHFLSTADASAILYSPRTSENLRLAMPNKLFDSLGAGVPCVAAEGSAAAEYLQRQGMGAVFADGDAMSLAAALESVISDGGFRERVSAAASSFHWPTIEPRLLALVADELAAAEVPLGQASSGSATPSPTGKPRYSWRTNPRGRARMALAWRLRKLAIKLEH